MGFPKVTMVIAVAVAIFVYVYLPGYPDTANNRSGKEMLGFFMNLVESMVSDNLPSVD